MYQNKQIKKKWMSKKIILGLTMGVIASCYCVAAPALADEPAVYNAGITGTTRDAATFASAYNHSNEKDTYTFNDGATINIQGGSKYSPITGVISRGVNLEINATNKPLTINLNPPAGGMTGITQAGVFGHENVTDVTINAKSLTLNMNLPDKVLGGGSLVGIEMKGTNSSKVTQEINANTSLNLSTVGSNTVNGILLHELTEMTVNGNLNINVKNTLPVENANGANKAVYGISFLPQALNSGSLLHVTGDVTINSSGAGISILKGRSNEGFSGNVAVDGGANIIAKDQAIYIQRGNVSINDRGIKDVAIKGDIVAQLQGMGDPESSDAKTYGGTNVNIKFNTPHSSFDGSVFADDKSAVNLTVANGAVWTNEMKETNAPSGLSSTLASLTGGDSPENAGFIVQNSKNPLTIKKYSGHEVVFFNHTGDASTLDNFAAGNIIVDEAAPKSDILLQTNNDGISTTDTAKLNTVLDTLAQKIIYNNYQTEADNLTAYVGIADGLTASSAVRNVASVDFKTHAGVGSSKGVSPIQNTETKQNNYNVQIYEENYRAAANQDFWNQEGVRTVSGNDATYNFNGDTTINIMDTNKNTSTVHKYDPRSGAIVWATDKNGVINMNNHSLSIVSGKTGDYQSNSRDMAGIYVSSGTVNINNVAGLNVDVKHTFLPSGIVVNGEKPLGHFFSGNGEAKLIINNDDNPANAVNINIENAYGEAKGYAGYGAAVESNGNSSGVALFQAKGLVNFNMVEKQYGILALQQGQVDIGGGTMKTTGGNYLIYSSGDVKINADHSKTRTVDLLGDIALGDIPLGDKGGNVTIALTNANDKFTGGISNDSKYTNMTLQVENGGVFTHEMQLDKSGLGKKLPGEMQPSKNGSTINNLIGSADSKTPGYIYQKDVKPLKIGNYSGNTVLFYDHNNSGTKANDFVAGDTIITKAEPNSNINVQTSNAGINMKDVNQVNTVLNNLAHKLVYIDSDNGKTDLKGTVGIADGLTASAATRLTSDISFAKNDQGHGSTTGVNQGVDPLPGTQNPPQSGAISPVAPTPGVSTPGVQVGEYENPVIKSVRSMMMAPALTWRSYAGEMNGLYANGWWGTATAGKTKYEKGNLGIDTDHHMLQVGYTHQDKNQSYGIGVMYHKGDTDGYHQASGKDTMYAADLYASYALPQQQRMDVSLKVGHVSQDIHAMNSLGLIHVNGTYKGTMTSLSAKYTKRIGTEKSYVDPEVQLTYSHMPSANFTMLADDNTTLRVAQSGAHSLVGSVGVTAGKMLNKGHVYAGLHVNHDFAGDATSKFNAADGGLKTVSYSLGDTWMDMTVGGDYRLAGGGAVYGQVSKGISGNYKKNWQLQAGLTLKF